MLAETVAEDLRMLREYFKIIGTPEVKQDWKEAKVHMIHAGYAIEHLIGMVIKILNDPSIIGEEEKQKIMDVLKGPELSFAFGTLFLTQAVVWNHCEGLENRLDRISALSAKYSETLFEVPQGYRDSL